MHAWSSSARSAMSTAMCFSTTSTSRSTPTTPGAYSQSKTANVLFAVEAGRRWAQDLISVNALNPGRITTTRLGRHIGTSATARPPFDPTSTDVSWKNIEQGAATSVLLAASPLVEVSPRYFEDCNEAGPHRPGCAGVPPTPLTPRVRLACGSSPSTWSRPPPRPPDALATTHMVRAGTPMTWPRGCSSVVSVATDRIGPGCGARTGSAHTAGPPPNGHRTDPAAPQRGFGCTLEPCRVPPGRGPPAGSVGHCVSGAAARWSGRRRQL